MHPGPFQFVSLSRTNNLVRNTHHILGICSFTTTYSNHVDIKRACIYVLTCFTHVYCIFDRVA